MQTDQRSVFLIGMMGAGKSTVGRLLAQQLNYQFVDADRELEARSGVPIPTIFEIEGEAGFRRREIALLDELTQRAGIVLATGGGAVLDADLAESMKERGLVIYLRASADEIYPAYAPGSIAAVAANGKSAGAHRSAAGRARAAV